MNVVIKCKKIGANYYNTMASFNRYKIERGMSDGYGERRKIYQKKFVGNENIIE